MFQISFDYAGFSFGRDPIKDSEEAGIIAWMGSNVILEESRALSAAALLIGIFLTLLQKGCRIHGSVLSGIGYDASIQFVRFVRYFEMQNDFTMLVKPHLDSSRIILEKARRVLARNKHFIAARRLSRRIPLLEFSSI
jgi:hypothetical protein